MKSSETGGLCAKNSRQRRPTLRGEPRVGSSCLHLLCVGDELIKRFAPPVIEAHFLVSLAAVFVPVHRESSIPRPASLWLEGNDRGEGECVGSLARRTVAWGEGNRPNELFVFDDLEIAADVRKFLSFRRTHYCAKDAAGTKV